MFFVVTKKTQSRGDKEPTDRKASPKQETETVQTQAPAEIDIQDQLQSIESLKQELLMRERYLQDAKKEAEQTIQTSKQPTDDQQLNDDQEETEEESQVKVQPPAEQQKIQHDVQALLQVALDKGLNEAVDTAQKTNDPYLLDELHDTLVNELYNRLIKEGKLKEF